MTDLESRAAELVAGFLGKLDHRMRPAAARALMRLGGNALAIATNHDEAAQAHIGLSRQHLERRGAR